MPFLPLRLDTQSNYWNSRYFFRRSLSGFWFLLDIPSWLWCLLLILLCLPALKKVQGIYCYYGEACVSGLHFPEKISQKSKLLFWCACQTFLCFVSIHFCNNNELVFCRVLLGIWQVCSFCYYSKLPFHPYQYPTS